MIRWPFLAMTMSHTVAPGTVAQAGPGGQTRPREGVTPEGAESCRLTCRRCRSPISVSLHFLSACGSCAHSRWICGAALRVDTLPDKSRRVSLHPRSLRRESTKGLPGPKYIQRCVIVSVSDESTGVTGVGTNGQAFLHPFATR